MNYGHFLFMIFYDSECSSGKYGPGCSQTCGHCRDGVTCHHENGNCETDACDKGWKGNTTCKTGKSAL